MEEVHLFGPATYAKPKPWSFRQEELPFGAIAVSSVLQAIAETRGFFSLGFPIEQVYELTGQEAKLAVHPGYNGLRHG